MISYIMINHQAYNFNKLLKNVEELTKSEVRSQKFLTTFRHYRTEVVERNKGLSSVSKTMRLKSWGFGRNYFR